LQKAAPKHSTIGDMSLHKIWSWKRAPCPCLFTLHQKRAPTFYTCCRKILLAESNSNFSFCLEIPHCKLFEVIWFYIVLCLHIKVVKGPPLAHIFALFWKTYDLLQSLRLQSGLSAFKQNNAKTKCESLKEGPLDISEKMGPRDDSLVRLP